MEQNKFGVAQVVLNGTDGYLAYQSIKNTDWEIASFIPIDEYGKNSYKQKQLFIMDIIILLLLFLLFIWLQKRYVLNPILELDKNIRKIDIRGNLTYRLPALKNDEFSSLDQSINRVLDKTEEYFLKIEKEEAELLQQHKLLIENEKKLKESENRWHFALEGAGDGVWDWNVQTNEVFFSPQWKRMLGFADGEIQNDFAEWDKRLHPEDKQDCYDNIAQYISQETAIYQIEHRLLCKDETYKWILSRAKFVEWTEDGKPLRLIGTHADISTIKAMESALAAEKELLKMTLLSVGDGVITTDNNREITMLNKVAEMTTGWTSQESIGKVFEEIFHIIDPLTGERCESPVRKALESGGNVFLEESTVLVSKDGRKIAIADSAAPIKEIGGDIKGVVVVFRDVTLEKKGQEQIRFLSYHDQLTGLYNRSFFEEELKRLDKKCNLPLTIIMADVNGLKITNDAFGHSVGDNLLKKSAEILKVGCRDEDVIARLGGDEFIIVLPKATEKEAEHIVQRIKKILSNTHVDVIGVSIAFGLATKNEVTEDIQEILKQADNSMYKNKSLESYVAKDKLIQSIRKLYEIKVHEEVHAKKVGELCRWIGSAYGLGEKKLQELEMVGVWHDIGKASLSEGIINQVGELSVTEWIEMKKHPEIGHRILKSIRELCEIANYVLAHHERWDGTGYPKGLKGEEIPWVSRVVAIAEAYESMCSGRSYCKGLSKEIALEELVKHAGKQFDPDIVKKFLTLQKI
jgi:diguanylate cyclase (GGDEF)-like protein/PAS domain S-box-containing protein